MRLLNQYLGKLRQGQPVEIPTHPNVPAIKGEKLQLFLDKKDNMQTSIRIGRRLFNKTHPDFAGFYVLNTVFGGYFGALIRSWGDDTKVKRKCQGETLHFLCLCLSPY